MRFYTTQHPFYCGIDLHARAMYVCILNQAGETLLHRNMQTPPEALLKAIAPYRDDIVVAVACMFTWYWLADLCAEDGIPFVLGHALSMKAIHGGKAKNDKIDAHKIAVLLRGGMLPQAYVSPAEMRATRDLLRRRMHLAHKRGELLAHVQNTNSQYNFPALGKNIAYKTNRDGVAERFADPAVQKSIEVDLALITYYDELLRDVELTIVKTAKHHDANTLYLLQTVPGHRQDPQPRAALRNPSDRPLPSGAGFCLLLPPGQVRQGICGETLWHLRHQNRQCPSQMGVFRSGRLIPPG